MELFMENLDNIQEDYKKLYKELKEKKAQKCRN